MPKTVSSTITKAYLDGAVAGIREDIREFVKHFTDSQHTQDQRFDQIDVKLEAIIDTMATRQEMKTLVHEIQTQGIAIDESKIFVS